MFKTHVEKLPRGYKDTEHLENLRVSEPGLKEYIVQKHHPRGWKDQAHRRALSRSNPLKKPKQPRKAKPPSIESIMHAIIHQEVVKQTQDPSSPRRTPRNVKDMSQVLGITDNQAEEIKSQGSPRLRAKAVGAAILNMRLPASCTRGMSDVSNKRFSSRQVYGF